MTAAKRTGSEVEDEFAEQMLDAGIPFERQFKAIPGRKFTWDFRLTGTNTLIEIQGGIWHKGGHSTGVGITRDCVKNNLAVTHGYRTLFFTSDMVWGKTALEVVKQALAALEVK